MNKDSMIDFDFFNSYGFSIQDIIDLRDILLNYLAESSEYAMNSLKVMSDFIYCVDKTLEKYLLSSEELKTVDNF